jgi:sigma-B regulation protein RsbU (phosphoserine phosphatase)
LVVLSTAGTIQTADPDGMAVGWMEDVEFEEINLQLQPGDRIFLYSDGVPEAMDGELNEYTDQRMFECMTASRETAIDDSVATLLQAVQKWCGRSGPKDDVSILALELGRAV